MIKKHLRNFLILTSLTAVSIHVINRIISITSISKSLLKTDHGRLYDWKYGKIYYTKCGKGSPVLLIHDLDPASSSQEWEQISKTLSKKHTVYTIDLLGCGRSSKPNLTYTNYLYVQLLKDFIKDVIHEKTDIVSTGSSCSFSVMACNMDPEYYNKLILVNPERLSDLKKTPDKKKNAVKLLIDLPIIGTMIYNICYSKYKIKKMTTERYHKNHTVSTKTIDTYYESAHLGSSNGKYLLSSINSNYTCINIMHALKKVNNSIYIIGSKENEYMKEIIDDYMEYNPSIETAFLEQSKYMPQIEVPKKILFYIELFLSTM